MIIVALEFTLLFRINWLPFKNCQAVWNQN